MQSSSTNQIPQNANINNTQNNNNNYNNNGNNTNNNLNVQKQMTTNEIEDGELKSENPSKSEERLFHDYTHRTPISQWSCNKADIYERVDQVGEGTFGKVYKARIKSPGKHNLNIKSEFVALKKILMENEKEGFPLTAIREIMILKRLSHKNIINLLEIVTSKPSEKNKFRGNVYLVFEYMEHDLSGLISRKYDFTLSMIKGIMKQILLGLEYLHENNIIHRDIKGANILLNNRGEVKLADFGLARLHNPDNRIVKVYTNRVVTLWYRSPELLLGEHNYGPAIDMWSVGCVFVELLTGIPPFRGQKEQEQIEKIFEKCGTPNEENWPGVSSLRGYNSLFPKQNYPNVLKSYYSDNKKIDNTVFDLLSKLLELNPHKRITCKEALKHTFFSESHFPKACEPNEFPTFEKDSHEYQSRINKKFQQHQQQQLQNMGNNPQFNQMQANNMLLNRGNVAVSKHPNVLFNNIERGSNIFVTSNAKPKEEDQTYVSKLGMLITNNEKANNDLKSEINLLQHKRMAEQSLSDADNLGAKKPKME